MTMLACMGGIVEEQIDGAVRALVRRDLDSAQSVIASDDRVDELERDVEAQAQRVIALRSRGTCASSWRA